MIPVLSKRSALIAVAGLMLVGCNDGPTGPSRAWTATVRGTIIDDNGWRVPNAAVTLRSLSILSSVGSDTLGKCVGQALAPQSLKADAHGDYSYTWHGAAIPAVVCLGVDATATDYRGTLTGSAHVDSITLYPLAIDDLQILVKVRPRP